MVQGGSRNDHDGDQAQIYIDADEATGHAMLELLNDKHRLQEPHSA
jgi:hypothetical protein